MKYVIVGNGTYAKMMRRYLESSMGIETDAFSVDGDIITEGFIDKTPVISSDRILNQYDPGVTKLIMGIGYRDMNQIKEREFIRYKGMGYCFDNYIHPTSIVDKSVKMGEGNNIFEGVIIQESVTIGDANLIYGGALISHETVIGNYNSISVKACIAGCTQVGNNCFFGANSTIRDHISISDFTLVGAGSYVDSDTSKYSVLVSEKSKVLEGKMSVELI